MAGNQDWDAQRYNRSFLKNSADPGGQIEIPEGVDLDEKEERKLLRHFTDRHAGPSKVNRPTVFPNGLKWVQNKIPHRDMRFMSQRTVNLRDIRMVFSVPKIALGMSDGVNYTTADVQERMFWNQTLFPEMALIEDALWNQFRFIEGGRFEILFDRSVIKVLQKDIGEKTTAAKDLFAIGAPASEVNRVLDMGLEPWDGWDISYLPLNLVPASMAATGAGANGGNGEAAALAAAEERRAKLVSARGDHLLTDGGAERMKATHPELYQVRSPFTPDQDAELLEKYNRIVYRPSEEKFKAKYSRWVMDHRVKTLRNFKRETDWEGDPTKTLANLGWFIRELPAGIDLRELVTRCDSEHLDQLVQRQEGTPDWDRILPDAEEWGEKLADSTKPVYESALLVGAAARAGDLEVAAVIQSIRADLALWIQEVCTDKIKFISPRLNLALKRSLVEGALLGETIDQLATRVKRIHNQAGNRAFTIARTEVGKAAEYGAYKESTESGLVEGHWWIPGGTNIRESHALMRGQFAALGTPFTTGDGNALMHPHDPEGIAKEVINCKCILRARLKP
jgi:hypothetical protein